MMRIRVDLPVPLEPASSVMLSALNSAPSFLNSTRGPKALLTPERRSSVLSLERDAAYMGGLAFRL